MNRLHLRPDPTALADQVTALLRDRGPLTTREIAEALPPEQWITCGHAECTRPEHRQAAWYGHMHVDSCRQNLVRLHRRGVIDRTPLDSARPTLWWLPEAATP